MYYFILSNEDAIKLQAPSGAEAVLHICAYTSGYEAGSGIRLHIIEMTTKPRRGVTYRSL